MPEIKATTSRRSGASFTPSAEPRERTQASQRAVAQRGQTPADYSGAIDGLIGTAGSLARQVAAAKEQQDQLAARKEDERQKRIGRLKAVKGEELTEAERADSDIFEAWTITKGEQAAYKTTIPSYTQAVEQLPLDADFEQFNEEFLRNHLKNGDTYGSGDDLYDTALYAKLAPVIEDARQVRSEAHAKQRVAEGIREVNENVKYSVQNGTILEDLSGYVETMQTVNPLDPQRAIPDVMFSMAEAAQGNRGQIEQVRAAAKQLSFDKKFPRAWEKFEEKLVNNYSNEMSWEAQRDFASLENGVQTLMDAGDTKSLLKVLQPGSGELAMLKDRHGLGGGRAKALEKTIRKYLTDASKDTIANNNMTGWALGTNTSPVDASAVRKNMLGWFEANGIDPLSPEATTVQLNGQSYEVTPMQIYRNFGYEVSDDLRNYYGKALVSNPESMTKALTMARSLMNQPGAGLDTALKLFPQDLRNEAQMLIERQDFTRQEPAELYEDLVNARKQADANSAYGWANVYPGDSSAASKGRGVAAQAVKDALIKSGAISGGVLGYFGDDVTISPQVLQFASDETIRHHSLNSQMGGDIASSAAHVAASILPSLDVINGVVVKSNMPDVFEGQQVHRMGAKFRNPHTGEMEDPQENWEMDAKPLSRRLEGLGYDGEVTLTTNARTDALGAYMVMKEDGTPLLLSDEQADTFSLRPTADERQLEGLRDDLLPEDDVDPDAPFELVDFGNGLNVLTYRVMPRHVPPTVDQKEQTEASFLEDMRSTAMGNKVDHSNSATDGPSFWRQARNWLLGSRRDDGTVAPSAGVTKHEDDSEVNDLDGLLNHVEGWNDDAKTRSGPRAFEPTYTPPRGTYNYRRFEHLKGVEAERLQAYDDETGQPMTPGKGASGKVTVGVGFNMDAPGAKQKWVEAGLPEADFKKVRSGEKRITQKQSRDLFDITIREAEDVVDRKFKDTDLAEHQRIALVSLAFNNPSLIGPNLTEQVKTGKWKQAIDEILLRSNRKRDKGLASRRYKEALLFAGADNKAQLPDFREYIGGF